MSEIESKKWREDGIPEDAREVGLTTSHDNLADQLKMLGEEITTLEKRLTPILRPERDDSVIEQAKDDGISPLHQKAEQAVNEVRWLRARVQTIDSRVAL